MKPVFLYIFQVSNLHFMLMVYIWVLGLGVRFEVQVHQVRFHQACYTRVMRYYHITGGGGIRFQI